MNIWIKKTNGRVIDIMFDGMHYTFNDRFMGLIAVATRKINSSEFVLEYGNSHNYYEGDNRKDAELCKREIIKHENQFVKSDVIFEEVQVDCNNKYFLTLDISER